MRGRALSYRGRPQLERPCTHAVLSFPHGDLGIMRSAWPVLDSSKRCEETGGCQGPGGKDKGECLLWGYEVSFGVMKVFWNQRAVMAAQHGECAECHPGGVFYGEDYVW